MNKESKIYVAGHRGMVGSAIIRKLRLNGYNNIITRTSKELDLRNQQETKKFFKQEQPDYVFLAAAKVGGIYANMMNKSKFLYDNIQISTNVIQSAYEYNTKKLVNLGSSCIYPKNINKPIKEEDLLSGPLEETNDAYALAKISALKMCQFYNEDFGTNYITLMPPNLYGPGDNYDLKTSHVLPALIRKFSEAKSYNNPYVEVWGTGEIYREFMYVDDIADVCLFVMNNEIPKSIHYLNTGTGKDISIKELVSLIKEITGYTGDIKWDDSKPNGIYKKTMDSNLIYDLGWKPKTTLKDGIIKTLSDFNKEQLKELISQSY